jgi:hypothetical protein
VGPIVTGFGPVALRIDSFLNFLASVGRESLKLATVRPIVVVRCECAWRFNVSRVIFSAALFLGVSAKAATSLSNFPRNAGGPITASAVVVALGAGEEPAVVVAAGSKLACFTPAGRVCKGFPVDFGAGVTVVGVPAAGDLEGDGYRAVVVALSDGRIVSVHEQGELRVLATSTAPGVGPSLADLDGDGKAEVVVGTRDGTLHAFRAAGGELSGFPLMLTGAVTSPVSIGRLAGHLAIVVGTEDGRLHAVDATGQALAGFPVFTRFAISGQAAIVDLDDDGENDVVVASQDYSLYAVHANGRALPGFPVDLGYRVYGGPAVADLDGDGKVEIVIAAGDGKVHALTASGRERAGFPVKVGDRTVAPAIAGDFDRDGHDQIALCTEEGELTVLRGNGRPLTGFPAKLGDKCAASPVAADLLRDGSTALVLGVSGGRVLAYRIHRAGSAKGDLSWPTAGRDESRSGRRHPNPPKYRDLTLSPTDPVATDVLKAEYRFTQADGEAEPKTIVRWWRQGVEVGDLMGKAEVPAGTTKRGEHWRFSLQARVDSAAEKGPEVVIRNSPPTSPKISVSPSPPRRGERTRVEIVGPASDPDGDALTYRFSWAKTGTTERRAAQELPPGTLRRGEHWTVTAVAYDGELEGPPATVEVVVANTPPTAPKVRLAPAAPGVQDAIKVVIDSPSVDADGDAVTYRYRWSLDGRWQNHPRSMSVFPANIARKGQRVLAEVCAWDGNAEGATGTAEAAMVNTPPSAPTIVILPAKPKRGDMLVAATSTPSVDPDGDSVEYRLQWSKNGKEHALPEGSTTVPGSEIRKGDIWAVDVVAHDGSAQSAPVRAEVKIGDTPPRPPVISLTDETPLAGDPVDVRIDQPARDEDGDAVTLDYAWSVDGAPSGLPPGTKSIPTGKTRKGQRWTIVVTPSDGEEKGSPAFAECVARNNPPTAPSIEFVPDRPTVLTGVAVRIVKPSTDRDQDSLRYRYAWDRNGRHIDTSPDTAELKPGQIRGGDAIRVTVVASDGAVEGARAQAHVTVATTPPQAPEVAIEPAKPAASDSLHCVVKKPVIDPDGDAPELHVTWLRNGKATLFPANTFSLPKGSVRHGETWRCEVVAHDSSGSSAIAAAEATVVNTRPSTPGVTIEPEAPATDDDLVCRVSHDSIDVDGDSLTYRYAWTRNGQSYSPPNDPAVVPASATTKGDRWRCEVTANDGQDESAVASDERIIKNSPPYGTSARISPASPVAGTTLQCEINHPASDPDGDAITYRFQWLKNGVSQDFAGSSAEVPGRLIKAEDIWRCDVTATDGQSGGDTVHTEDVIVGGETARALR